MDFVPARVKSFAPNFHEYLKIGIGIFLKHWQIGNISQLNNPTISLSFIYYQKYFYSVLLYDLDATCGKISLRVSIGYS